MPTCPGATPMTARCAPPSGRCKRPQNKLHHGGHGENSPSVPSVPPWLNFIDKIEKRGEEGVLLFVERGVAGLRQYDEPRSRDEGAVGLAKFRRHEAVLGAPHSNRVGRSMRCSHLASPGLWKRGR